MAVARNAALLTLIACVGVGEAWAQGSLRLPPLPDAKPANTKPAQTPTPLGTTRPAPPVAPAPTPAPAPAAKPAATGESWPGGDPVAQTRTIQLLLRDLGLYSNTTNGTLGPATRAAIREFQRSNGDPETGEPSEKLIEDLRRKTQN